MIKITAPISKESIWKLKAGEEVLLSGRILTGRDQAHKRLVELIKKGKRLPVDLRGQIIYYVGPNPAPRGKIIGACGPTTSSRMDNFTPALIKKGILGMIGKGKRSPQVVKTIKKHQVVYFLAPAGLGAFLAQKVIAKKCVAFKELGPEAIYELKVRDFPLIVGIDSQGRNIYENA